MVDLITEKIGAVNSFVIQQKQEDKTPKFEGNKTSNVEEKAKKIFPFGMIAGGGLLIYYGVKKPSEIKFLKKLAKERISKIGQNVQEFVTETKRSIPETFKELNKHIQTYKKNRWIKPSEILTPLENAKIAEDVIAAQDSGFEIIQNEINKCHRQGATDFDDFLVQINKTKLSLCDKLNLDRYHRDLANGDLIHFPKFKDEKHKDLIETLSKDVDKEVKSASESMKQTQNEEIAQATRKEATKFSKIVTETRHLVSDTKSDLIDKAFPKIRKMLGLGEDFIPNHRHIANLKRFEQLSAEELKPQTLPQGAEKIFANTIFENIMKTKDFSKLDDKEIQMIFARMSITTSVNDLGIMADRLRIKSEFAKSKGLNEEVLYNNALAKVEFLQNKLYKFGLDSYLEKAQTDFSKLNPEQKRAKFASIYSITRKMGYNTIEQMDKAILSKHRDYKNCPFRKQIPEIKQHPEMYYF